MAGEYPVAYNASLYVLCVISILCGMVTIGIVMWVWYNNPASKESPSFNLSLWIAFSDFALRAADILSNQLTFGANYPRSHHYAKFILWLTTFSSYWFIYLNSMIALDLHLVFFHHLPRYAPVRRWYALIGTGIAFFASFCFLILPDVHMVTGGMVSPGVQGSTGLVFAEYWTNIWFHLGVVYTLGVVIAVCIKVFKSQRNVGRFNQGLSNKNMSPTLLRNTRLIMAYPAVLLVIYVPYIMSMWFGTYLQGLFVYYWVMAINVVYNMQGVFSFIIFLFHPVMLSTYNKHNISIGLVWTKVTRRLHLTGSSSTGFSGSTLQGGGSHQRGNHFAGETEVAPVDSTLPHLKSLDMGPGVTNLFNGVEKDDRTYTSTFQSMKSGFISPEISAVHDGDLENQVLLSEFNDPACL